MMRRIGIWLGIVAMTLVAGGASAITTDGDWADWFTYGGNVSFNNWQQGNYVLQNLNIRTFADEEGPTPGGGGQLYDIEEIFYVYDDLDPNASSGGTLYVGMVTGFPSGGIAPYYAGDLFLGLGASGDLNIAVGVGTEAANAARFERAYFGSPGDWIPPLLFGASTPWRMNEGTAADVTAALTPDVAWGTHGVHHFMEVAISLDGSGEDQITGTNGGLSLHWTMGCGNDEITVNDDEPFVPVPEPATAVLFGMGVLGIVLRAKRPRI